MVTLFNASGHQGRQYPPRTTIVKLNRVTSADSTGRGLFRWSKYVCLPMMVILPVSLVAQENGAALLRSSGGVLVNKSQVPASVALLRDDLIETPKDAVARLEVTGSAADINSETVVQFEGDELVLDHGSLSVRTSRQFRVRVGCLTVTPVNPDWTEYEVTDRDGKVTVSARKSDVYLDAQSANGPQKRPTQSNRATVHESEQKSRDEKCAGGYLDQDHIAGKGGFMNSRYAIAAGISGIVVVTCYALCRSGEPLSPSAP